MRTLLLVLIVATVSLVLGMPHDKLLHMGISSMLSSVIGSFGDAHTGFIGAVLIGVSKEIYDLFGPGTPELGDVVADVLGATFGESFLSDKKIGILIVWEF